MGKRPPSHAADETVDTRRSLPAAKGGRAKPRSRTAPRRNVKGRPGHHDDAAPADGVECLEITDERDRPLMVMPIAQARRQPVRHRVVLVMLYDAEGRIYLQKRAANKRLYPGRWDLSATGHVLAGESREDAALRELREELGIAAGRLIRRAEIPATEATDFAHVTLFVVGPVGEAPQPNPDEVADGMFVDADELDALLEHFRDMLTPALIWAAERGDVFRDMPCPVYADEPKLSEQS
ncbi:NUDIX hydrolase [Nitratidesulfovibrio oxamicus]|uniref:NUDIX hydrolase n=1 Tax=Nitratidesulfovibrio oxamicus TaxID=32016 RepID=UPI0027DBB9B4|nr:NUDIX domain-containing protein [Nitratidesulfovibrio oxamicus]